MANFSKIQICNSALSLLGEQPIQSLTDTTIKSPAVLLNSYDTTRLALLRQFPWNFALKRAITAPTSDKPLFGYKYQHRLPADLVKVVELVNDYQIDYEIEGGLILTDENKLSIRYVGDIEEVGLFDDGFVNTFGYALAISICMELTKKSPNGSLIGRFNQALRIAKLKDSQETKKVILQSTANDSWVNARR